MTKSIWQECQGNTHIIKLHCDAWRVVESQEQVATTELVNGDLDAQQLLELLLDRSKPPAPKTSFHYLLITPFRYPPLRHGSRFGRRDEPSLFYGSETIYTGLAETAFYRLIFLEGMSVPFPESIRTDHTLFKVRIKTAHAICLQKQPFNEYEQHISSASSYTKSQQLGQDMRAAGVAGFQFRSARDVEGGINTALFYPSALSSKKPTATEAWQCVTNHQTISFSNKLKRGQVCHFPREQFLIAGKLPTPAL